MPQSKRKGYYNERKIVSLLNEAGIPAQRVPLSGALGRTSVADLRGDIDVLGKKAEVKSRANGAGFATLEKWLGDNDYLIMRQDRAEPFVAMKWGAYIELLHALMTQGVAVADLHDDDVD